MSIEIAKIKRTNGEGFSIWVDGDEAFNDAEFLKSIDSLELNNRARVVSSFGPAEFIDEIQTRYGAFHLSQKFDELSGTTIYSDSHELMERILKIMVGSGKYHVR